MRQPVPILFIRIREIVSIGNVLRAYAIRPLSRRTKPISKTFRRLPAAENRFSEIFFHFPPRESVFLRIYPISRRGKAFFGSFDLFPAAGRRFWKSAIGFAFHFGVSEITRSVSCLIFAIQKFGDRPRAVR